MSPLFWLLLPAVLAGGIAFALTPSIARLAVMIGAIDMPGGRKIHTAPVPRLGGLSVVISVVTVLLGSAAFSNGVWNIPLELTTGMLAGILPILLISIVDDVKTVGPRTKVLVHTVGASVAVACGVSLAQVVHLFGTPINIGPLAAPISIVWIIGVTNAFNIIDGLDGLAAGLALIAATSMAAVFGLVQQPAMSGAALVLAGALGGFLPYNTHPAKLFLGDTGATAIGFCLALFALKGGSTLSTGFAALLPVFMLGLPIADTLIAIARRMLASNAAARGAVFQADRNHIHHRLLALGVDHRRAVLILYASGLLLGAAALTSVFLNAREAGLFVVALLLAGVVGVHRLGYDEFAFIKRGTVLKVYEIPVVRRGMFVVFLDIVLVGIAAYVAVGLKTDQWSLAPIQHQITDLTSIFAPVTVVVFWWSGTYRGSWRIAGVDDLARIGVAATIVTIAGATVVECVSNIEYSASLLAIYGVLLFVMSASVRGSYVVLKSKQLRASHSGIPVLIYGAGSRGATVARELFHNRTAGLRPIGFIDDDARKRGRLVCGLLVFGSHRELETIVQQQGSAAVLIATESIAAERLDLVSSTCLRAGVSIFRMDFKLECVNGNWPVNRRQENPRLAAATRSDAAAIARSSLTESQACPSCGKSELSRSRTRSAYDRVRKACTRKRLFRCLRCGWRGWALPVGHAPNVEHAWFPDMSNIDGVLSESALKPIDDIELRDVI